MGSGASVSEAKRDAPEETVQREQVREDAAQSTSQQGEGGAMQRIERKDSAVPPEDPPVVEDRHAGAGERNTQEPEEGVKHNEKPQTPGPVPDDVSRDEVGNSEIHGKPPSVMVDVDSSDTSISEREGNEDPEEIQRSFNTTSNESAVENEEVPVDFESFLHRNGILYTCVSQHGHWMYVDESKGLVPFPTEWYDQGRFISGANEVTNQVEDPVNSHNVNNTTPVAQNDRAGMVFIQGKGTVMTYMFEEKVNICRYYDIQSGLWLLLPLQWEMNIDFVKQSVKKVMDTLPGLADQKEIIAALRLCNYDPDEVMSIYLTIFGDSLFQSTSKAPNLSELNSFRSHLEKDRLIEELKQKLHTKENELEKLFQRNSYLVRDTKYLAEMVEHLNQRVAELEADKQEAREKIRALLNRRSTKVPAKVPPKPSVDPGLLRQVSCLTRELNVSNKQLGSTVRHVLVDLQNHFQQLRELVGKMTQAEQHRVTEQEELRSLYMKEALERKTLYNKLLELQGNIRVFCRCRGNAASNSCLEVPSEQEVVVIQKGGKKKFNFDKVYSSKSTQEQIFDGTLPIITSCVDGYNVCILAYGQTGSGKTYTMMGPKNNPGVNIRSIRELLSICKNRENVTYTLKVSMLEIYNDTLNDLLAKNPNTHLDIRTQGKSVTVPGLTEVEVKTEDDILHVMEMGEKNRKIASTKMNIESSRSHLILTLAVVGADSISGVTSHGTLTLCDLAGSERISKTEAKGQRLVEAAAINKSLTALGQVFSALKCNAIHVPFRNSKLTHLLQPCLCGDAKACVFVNVSPDAQNIVETLSTLQFGSSIRQVALGKATQHVTSTPNTRQDKNIPGASTKNTN